MDVSFSFVSKAWTKPLQLLQWRIWDLKALSYGLHGNVDAGLAWQWQLNYQQAGIWEEADEVARCKLAGKKLC